jgi:hypothetical protein
VEGLFRNIRHRRQSKWETKSIDICEGFFLYIVTIYVAIDGVWIGEWILLTTYTHHSELQAITALSLIPALYRSLHAKSSLACSVSNSRSLTTASNSGDPSASRAQVLSSQSPVQNSFVNCQLYRHLFSASLGELNSLLQTVLLITSRHGPHRKQHVSTPRLLLRAYSFPRERVYQAVDQKRSLYVRLLHSNGCACYSIVNMYGMTLIRICRPTSDKPRTSIV